MIALVSVFFAFPLFANTLLTGRVVAAHPDFEDHMFINSFLYVEEVREYYPVNPDGTFEIAFRSEGGYTIQTVCPGFVAAIVPVRIPFSGELEVALELQMIEITVKVVQEIPEHIVNLRGSIKSFDIESTALTDNQYHEQLSDALENNKSPTVDFVRIFGFLKEQIEKRKEEREKRRAARRDAR